MFLAFQRGKEQQKQKQSEPYARQIVGRKRMIRVGKDKEHENWIVAQVVSTL